jgi:hypothetical protein
MIYLRPSKADEQVEPDKCLVCSREERLRLWTLDNGKRAGAMFLCPEHAAPLEVLMDASAGVPPARQKSLRDERELPPPPKVQRKRPMAPLEWTPPD